MCGICGIIDYSGQGPDESIIREMTRTLHHRGPDDRGIHVAGAAGLGHTRLSIIDLSETGHQPMHSKDGRYTIVYNGELYNFLELRRELEREGIGFRGRSDTEVLLKALIRWGPAVLARLNGMFALALWDSAEQTLTLARDRFGIKPLYYARFESGLVFGSEIKALLPCGHVRREMDWAALHEYLYYGNPLGERTFFDGVTELLPAHYLVHSNHGMKVQSYWSVYDLRPIHDDVATATYRVAELLDRAVSDHLISDVPVGVFLSGGIDSSAITALASRHYGGRLATYSVAFDFDEGIDELPKARRLAQMLGTDHHELRVAAENIPQIIEAMVRCHDEPFADPADIPLYLLCRELRGSVKVILQGDGGDEIFAGYRRYNVLAHERLWRRLARIASPFGSLLPGGPRGQRARRFLDVMAEPDASLRTARYMTIEPKWRPPTTFLSASAREAVEATDPFARYREACGRLSHLDPVQRMLHVDSMILLPDTFLEKVDKSTMAHSIEVRVPMLDANLTDYVMALPSNLKVRNRQKKWIIRRALRGIVPDFILDGPKTGLGVPIGGWLRGPLAGFLREVLLDRTTTEWGLFDRKTVERCIAEHLDRRRDNWFMLYKLIQLVLWRRHYLSNRLEPELSRVHG